MEMLRRMETRWGKLDRVEFVVFNGRCKSLEFSDTLMHMVRLRSFSQMAIKTYAKGFETISHHQKIDSADLDV